MRIVKQKLKINIIFLKKKYDHLPFLFQSVDDEQALENVLGRRTVQILDVDKRGLAGVQLWIMTNLLHQDG